MKITCEIALKDIKSQLTPDKAYGILSCFEDEVLMDAIERIDYERGDWVILERMSQIILKLSRELSNEIDEAFEDNHISKETYEFLKGIKQ